MGEEEEKVKLYSNNLSKRLFFIDSETYAALKANNMSVDEFSELLFSITRELSISDKNIDGGYFGQSSLTDTAKGVLAKILKISSRDISCMLSKNYLYYKLLKLDSRSSDFISTLSDRWFYNIEVIKTLEKIKVDQDYNVDLNLLEQYENDRTFYNSNEGSRVFKNTNGVVYLLTAAEIKSLSLGKKETINYFYEDMLKIFSIVLKDEELYTSDLFLKYLEL